MEAELRDGVPCELPFSDSWKKGQHLWHLQ